MKRVLAVAESVAVICTGLASIVLVWFVLTGHLFGSPPQGPQKRGGKAATEDIESQKLQLALPTLTASYSPRSEVVMIEVSDFQCPYCGKFNRDTFPHLRKDFVESGKIRYSFVNLPIAQLHPDANNAAIAAECASNQHKFWEMHDYLFEGQSHLMDAIAQGPKALDLDQQAFGRCLGGTASQEAIKTDVDQASRLGVHSTPTFFVGTLRPDGQVVLRRRINGAQPYETFKKALKDLGVA